MILSCPLSGFSKINLRPVKEAILLTLRVIIPQIAFPVFDNFELFFIIIILSVNWLFLHVPSLQIATF